MARALAYDEFGSTDVLYLADVPDVPLIAGQIRVDIRAAGLNPLDFKLRMGKINFSPKPFPRGAGQDFAGVVVEVFPGAAYSDGEEITVGDDVLGWVEQQAIRERLNAVAAQTVPKPSDLSWALAGSLQTSGLTAIACIDYLDIGEGDTVLVSAAAGGVGLIYSQLATLRGARVIGSASENNFALLRSLGVEPVSYGDSAVDEILALAPGGITAVQDNIGQHTIELALELGVPKDRICSIGDHGYAVKNGIGSPGMYERVPAKLAHLASQIAVGEIVLPDPIQFGLDDFKPAYDLLETRRGRGKIVLCP